MSKKKGKRQRRSISASDKILGSMDSAFVMQIWLAKMSPAERKEFEESWRNTPRWSEMTEEEQKACEEEHEKEQAELRDEQRLSEGWEHMRRRLLIMTDAISNHPESELYRTVKELLNTVDKAQADPFSVSSYERRKFQTDFLRCKALVEAEIKKFKEAETGRENARAKEDEEKGTKIDNVNIQNFQGILGDVQGVENLQIAKHASICKELRTQNEPTKRTTGDTIWRLVKKVPRWCYAIIGFLAALLTVFNYLGWL